MSKVDIASVVSFKDRSISSRNSSNIPSIRRSSALNFFSVEAKNAKLDRQFRTVLSWFKRFVRGLLSCTRMVSYMVGVSDVFFDTCLSKTGSLLFDNSSMAVHSCIHHITRSSKTMKPTLC